MTYFWAMLLLLLPLGSVANAAEVDISPRIIGGVEVTNNNTYPFVATIYGKIPNSNNATFCGGSLITSEWVVTAAHCVYYSGNRHQAADFHIFINQSKRKNFNSDGFYEVDKIVIHSDYTPGQSDSKNDIALLHLKSPVTNATPIFLGSDVQTNVLNNASNKTKILRALGWGAIDNENRQIVNQLRKVDLDFINNNTCRRSFSSVDSSQLCAGGLNDSRDTCNGDSGGPLMAQYRGNIYLMGITSFGPTECGKVGVPAVYTSVPFYSDWIMQTINNAADSSQQTTMLGSASSPQSSSTTQNGEVKVTVKIINRSRAISAHNVGFTVIASNTIDIPASSSGSGGLLGSLLDLLGGLLGGGSKPVVTCGDAGTEINCTGNTTLDPKRQLSVTLPIRYLGSVNDDTQLGIQILPLADETNLYRENDLLSVSFEDNHLLDTQVTVSSANNYEKTTRGSILFVNRGGDAASRFEISLDAHPGLNISLSGKDCRSSCSTGTIGKGRSFSLAFDGSTQQLTNGLSMRVTDASQRVNTVKKYLLSPQLDSATTAQVQQQVEDSNSNKPPTTNTNNTVNDSEKPAPAKKSGGGGGGGSAGMGLFILLGACLLTRRRNDSALL